MSKIVKTYYRINVRLVTKNKKLTTAFFNPAKKTNRMFLNDSFFSQLEFISF